MGKLITLSGVNGVGKSTQAQIISNYLKENDNKTIVTRELFNYHYLNKLTPLLKKSAGHKKKIKKINSTLMFKLWFIPAYFDIWLGHLFNVNKLVKKYDYVIADRSYVDLWLSIFYYGYQPKWAFNFFIKYLPKSDLAIIFLAKPKTIELREKGFPKEYYVDQIHLYKKINAKLKYKTINADTNKSVISKKVISLLKNYKFR